MDVCNKSVWNRFGHSRRAAVVRSTEAQEVPSQRLNASTSGALKIILYFAINNSNFLGEVAERLNALVLKTSKGASPSRVRIPPSPPKIQKPRQGLSCF